MGVWVGTKDEKQNINMPTWSMNANTGWDVKSVYEKRSTACKCLLHSYDQQLVIL